jgi:streptogramin lyase
MNPRGEVSRHRLKAGERPISLTVAPDGAAWFGLYARYNSHETAKVGRVSATGTFAEYRVPGYPASIAVDRTGRAWFTSFAGWRHPRLGVIDPEGKRALVCADPSCSLEPSGLVTTSDGSLWYALARPNLNEGGGGSGIGITTAIENEAGSIARLTP